MGLIHNLPPRVGWGDDRNPNTTAFAGLTNCRLREKLCADCWKADALGFVTSPQPTFLLIRRHPKPDTNYSDCLAIAAVPTDERFVH